jgi:hypothetical protein
MVNYLHNFVDPQTGAHEQTAEIMWTSAEMRNKHIIAEVIATC